MKKIFYVVPLLAITAITTIFIKFNKEDEIMIPKAKKIEHFHHYHDEKICDPYHWLRQENWSQESGVTNPEILNYINQENTYAKSFFKKHKTTVDKLYKELVETIDVDDETYPIPLDNFSYYTKSIKGKNYVEHWRINLNTNEHELVIDQNALAKGCSYFKLGFFSPSRDHKTLAYAVDTDGSERFKLYVVNFSDRKNIIKPLSGIASKGLVWNKDNAGFYFQRVDDNWRSNTVFFYDLKSGKESLIFEEKDHTNHVSITKSSDKKYLFIYNGNAHDNVVYTISLEDGDEQQPKHLLEKKTKYSLSN